MYKEFMTPAEVAKKMGTSGTLVRLSLLQGLPGWSGIKYFMCGRNMKIPSRQFEQWFHSAESEYLKTRLRDEVNHRTKEIKEIPDKKPLKVRAIKIKRR